VPSTIGFNFFTTPRCGSGKEDGIASDAQASTLIELIASVATIYSNINTSSEQWM